MNIFFVALCSAFFLSLYIAYTSVACVAFCTFFILFRFRERLRLLSYPYCRLTTYRLLRFVRHNIATLQCIFSLNRLYGPLLLVYLLVVLPPNIMMAIYLMRNRLSYKQSIFLLVIFTGQLTCIFGMHLVAAIFSKKIHSPFKRIMSLNILIKICPLRARIHLANSIQTFHVQKKRYGVTYGSGKYSFGLVTMMSFTKFILFYG